MALAYFNLINSSFEHSFTKYTTQNNSYVLFLGIKGLVLTRMLLSFERLFGSPIIHNFDWLVGTSTGGILALALATGKTAIE